jgi:hypothetical protein
MEKQASASKSAIAALSRKKPNKRGRKTKGDLDKREVILEERAPSKSVFPDYKNAATRALVEEAHSKAKTKLELIQKHPALYVALFTRGVVDIIYPADVRMPISDEFLESIASMLKSL